MTQPDLLVMIQTAGQRYLVRRDQFIELRLISWAGDLERPDPRGKALLACDLANLFNLAETNEYARRHALIVPTRRRGLALLVDRADDLTDSRIMTILPLPKLLARRLARPWFLGVALEGETPLLLLDLRQIAQDAMLTTAAERLSARSAEDL